MRINIIFLTMALSLLFGEVRANDRVEQWKIFELPFHLKVKGNPFDDVTVKATFINGADTVNIKGFYDGDDVYRVRSMPPTLSRPWGRSAFRRSIIIFIYYISSNCR